MKKVGLMTWYKDYNYGTALQATAIYTILKELGYDVYIIDYTNKIKFSDLLTNKNNLFSVIHKKIYNLLRYRINYDNYKVFEQYVNEVFDKQITCNSYLDLYQLNYNTDIFICGSDQIWSPRDFDEYFLNFADKSKIISYAPSIGLNNLKSNDKKRLAKLIKRFEFLSIREETGKKIIKEICNKDAKVVLDPTLLFSKEQWDKFENNKCLKNLDKSYILCYFLGNSNNYLKTIKKYAKKYNLKIYNIPNFRNKKINKYDLPFNVSPKDFITLIKNASCIFTDSFHGTIFSIIYNKDFYTFKRFKSNDKNNQNSRIMDLLKKLQLTERLIDNSNYISKKHINYDMVNNKLSTLKQKSLSFLSNSLKNIENLKNEKNFIKEKSITNYCCGCGACKTICPVNAIEIKMDNDGFYQYFLDKNKCMNCGKCKNICPMVKLDTKNIEESKLFSFKIKNSINDRFSYLIAKKLINQGYYVCGCIYDDVNATVKHIIIKPNQSELLEKIKKAKYIQSNTIDVFDKLVNLENKFVFFGTPCQVAGLAKLLNTRNKRDFAILIDLVCAGVPTKFLVDKYLKEKKNDSDKSKNNYFKFIYEKKNCYMKSCYDCPYRNKSSADIRIGNYDGKLNNSKTLMILTNTTKGNELISKLNSEANVEEHSINNYYKVHQICNFYIPQEYRTKLILDLKNPKIKLKKVIEQYYGYEIVLDKLKHIIQKFKQKKE